MQGTAASDRKLLFAEGKTKKTMTILQLVTTMLLLIFPNDNFSDHHYKAAEQIPSGFREDFYLKSLNILNLIDKKMRIEEPYTEAERKKVLHYFMVEFAQSDEELIFKGQLGLLDAYYQRYIDQKNKMNTERMEELKTTYEQQLKTILQLMNIKIIKSKYREMDAHAKST